MAACRHAAGRAARAGSSPARRCVGQRGGGTALRSDRAPEAPRPPQPERPDPFAGGRPDPPSAWLAARPGHPPPQPPWSHQRAAGAPERATAERTEQRRGTDGAAPVIVCAACGAADLVVRGERARSPPIAPSAARARTGPGAPADGADARSTPGRDARVAAGRGVPVHQEAASGIARRAIHAKCRTAPVRRGSPI